ncbi:MAG: PKD-like family lipoprotein [Dysgonomonas sp.]|nr:PKD-like family lipoprotein [Dysgonomonas sp.]
MKKLNIFVLFSILFLSFLLFSCNEDKGNYDYVEVSDVINTDTIFSNVSYYYTAQAGEVLEIKPTLIVSDGISEDEFVYNWYGFPATDKARVFLSEGKDLSFPIQKMEEFDWTQPTSAGREYIIVCEVKNKETGVIRTYQTKLNVNTSFRYGYMILTKKPGDTFDVELLARTGTTYKGITSNPFTYDSLYTNVFKSLANVDLNAKPVGLLTIPDFLSPRISTTTAEGRDYFWYGVYLLTSNNTYRLSPVTYSYEEEYSIKNIIESWSPLNAMKPFTVEKIEGRSYHTGATMGDPANNAYLPTSTNGKLTRILFLINGDWYFYNTESSWIFMDQPINRFQNGNRLDRYNVAPEIVINSVEKCGLLFNNDTKKFMYHSQNPANLWTTSFSKELANKDIQRKMLFEDVEPSDPNTELVYMTDTWQSFAGNTKGANIHGYAIMKGKSDEYRLVSFKLKRGKEGPEPNKDSFRRVYLPTEIKNVKFWERRLNRLFCVTADNKIYSLALTDLQAEFDDDEKPLNITVQGKGDSYWSNRLNDVTSEFISSPYSQITCFKSVDDVQNKSYWTSQYTGTVGAGNKGSIVLGTINPGGEEGKNGKIQFLQYNSTQNKLEPASNFQEFGEDGKTKVKITNPTWTGIGEVVDVAYKNK